MHDNHFYLPAQKPVRLVTIYADAHGEGIEPAQGDEGDIPLDTPNYPIEGAQVHLPGGSGLSSTTVDYGQLLLMLLNDGQLEKTRLLSRKSVEMMCTERIDTDGDGEADFGLGFQVDESIEESTSLTSPGVYSWGGAFYTYYWVDPAEQMLIVFMSQVRPRNSTVHERVKVLVYQALQ